MAGEARVLEHPHGEPAWVDLLTPDRDRALRFYGALFGWDFDQASDGSAPYSMCLLDKRQVCSIGDLDGHGGLQAGWNTYLAVDDVDAAAEAVARHEGALLLGPLDILTEGRLALIADPLGAVVGLWQARDHRGAQVLDEPGAFAHSVLTTHDPRRARAFYRGVLGRDFAVPGRTGRTTVRAAGPGEERVGWTVCFRAADQDALGKASAHGGAVIGRYAVPAGDIAVIRDPEGMVFAVLAD